MEAALGRLGLGETAARPLPGDLRDTLYEFGEIRNVLLHRVKRIDDKALSAVCEGPWTTRGEEVVVDPTLYRRYVAALWAFPDEITNRLLVKIGDNPGFDVDLWRSPVPVGG